jgi:hypothetical protein
MSVFNVLWNKFESWIASKGGFAHLVAAIYLGAIGAYAAVPAFEQLVDNVYGVMPHWLKLVALAVVGCIAWYRNNQASLDAPAVASALKPPTGAGTLKMLLALALIPTVLFMTAPMTACSQTEYTEIVGYVNEFLPVAESVANLVITFASPQDVATAQSIEAQVNSDFQLIASTAATITTQNYSDKRAAILALAADAQKNLASYLTALHISNPAAVAKAQAYVALGDAVITEIVNALPAANDGFPKLVGVYPTQAQADAALAQRAAVTKLKLGKIRLNYKHEYNRITMAKTGDVKVDAVLAKQKLFFVPSWHGWHPAIH